MTILELAETILDRSSKADELDLNQIEAALKILSDLIFYDTMNEVPSQEMAIVTLFDEGKRRDLKKPQSGQGHIH